MVIKNICVLVLRAKVALEGLNMLTPRSYQYSETCFMDLRKEPLSRGFADIVKLKINVVIGCLVTAGYHGNRHHVDIITPI